MGNNYSPPKVDKVNNAVEEQVRSEQSSPIIAAEFTPVDLYKEVIDNFIKFLKKEIHNGNLEERQAFQRQFINSVWAMLKLDDSQVKPILDHFVVSISENKDVFDFSNVLAPLYSIEKTTSSTVTDRYKKFMMFIITFSENAKRRQVFLSKFDMTKFESLFEPVSRERIHNYVYR